MNTEQRCDANASPGRHSWKVSAGGVWRITGSTGEVYESCDTHLAYLCFFDRPNTVEFIRAPAVRPEGDT